jgi:hypothetical protein
MHRFGTPQARGDIRRPSRILVPEDDARVPPRYASPGLRCREAVVATVPGHERAASMAGHGRLQASHADREQAIDALKAAFVQA